MKKKRCPNCKSPYFIQDPDGSWECGECGYKEPLEAEDIQPKSKPKPIERKEFQPKPEPTRKQRQKVLNNPTISHPNLNWISPELGKNGYKVVLGIGAIVMIAGMNMDTTHNGVHNIGLIKDSQNLVELGATLTISGAIFSLKR